MGMCLHLLRRLPGESDRDIDKFVTSLPQAQLQALWKKFEYNRHACLTKEECDDFSELASGPGSQQRKRNLLNAWLIAGHNASSKAFQDLSFFQASIIFQAASFKTT